MKINILGVKVDNLSKNDVIERISSYLNNEDSQHLVTPNPEFVLAAQKDPQFKKILNQAEVAIPDGTGLVFASWWLKHLNLGNIIRFNNRICGSDLVLDIAKIAEEQNKKIFILSRESTLSGLDEIQTRLTEKFSQLQIVGYQLKIGESKDKAVQKIIDSQAEILLVTFGAPDQDKFIYNYRAQLPNLRLAAGVGGSFDFLCGKIKRAPKIFRQLGLEWIWRFIQEPRKRSKRIYRAFLVFHQQVFWYGLFTKINKKYVNKKYS